MYTIAMISFVFILISVLCIYSIVDTHLLSNPGKMKALISVAGILFLIFVLIFIGSMYFIFNPHVVDTFNKTTSNIDDGYKYFTEYKCESILFSMTDLCTPTKKYRVSYKVVYGEPESVLILNE